MAEASLGTREAAMRWVAGLVAGLAALLLLVGCTTPYRPMSSPSGSGYRDQAIGDNRYHIDVALKGASTPGLAEEYFYRRALEIAQEQGFDSYRVVDLRSGYESDGYSRRPVARGVIQLYRKSAQGGSGGGAFGTGFFVSADGALLTNHHVVPDCRDISLRQVDGTTAPLSRIADDATNDLALLRAPITPPAVASFRDGAEVRQGDNVVAVGFPLAGMLASGTILTTGSISALAGLQNDSRELQVSAPVQPGNSGGPLLDQSGHVVGINSSGLDAAKLAARTGIVPQNVNFAIKSSVARTFLEINAIAYQRAPSSATLTTAEIGAQAQKFTVQILCVR
jgi:S1-C subfamily serine protease